MARRLFLMLAIQFGVASFIAVWLVGLTACGVFAAMSGLCVVVAGAIGAATDPDCGYDDTLFGRDADEFDVITAQLGEFRGVWPNEAGAFE